MGIIPKAGTPEHESFMRKASGDPNCLEARILRKAIEDAQRQHEAKLRAMLDRMIELVPGQLFRDVERLYKKFDMRPPADPGHRLPDDLLQFRIKLLLEELFEYVSAVGLDVAYAPNGTAFESNGKAFDAEGAFDSLIDLVVVALGTAYLHSFKFNEGWDRVQAANMAKVRVSDPNDPRSHRGGFMIDLVKPAGWEKPILKDLL